MKKILFIYHESSSMDMETTTLELVGSPTILHDHVRLLRIPHRQPHPRQYRILELAPLRSKSPTDGSDSREQYGLCLDICDIVGVSYWYCLGGWDIRRKGRGFWDMSNLRTSGGRGLIYKDKSTARCASLTLKLFLHF